MLETKDRLLVDHADAEVGAKDKRTSGDRNFMVDVGGRLLSVDRQMNARRGRGENDPIKRRCMAVRGA